jgi:hypothetical protein
MIATLALVAGLIAWLWIKHRLRVAKFRRVERARQKALQRPRRARTAAVWVLHRILRRRFVWRPSKGLVSMNTPCPVARRGPFRTVSIRIDRHVLLAGLTGSGKSSTVRVLAAHALRAGARLVLVDLKPGAPEGDLYRDKAQVITSAAELVALVRQLLADPQPCVIIVDEMASLVRQLTDKQFAELCSLVDIARAFNIWFWLAAQHPSRVNLPTEIQANVQVVVAHRVRSKVESDVIFHDTDWRPDRLTVPGACMVQVPKAKPVPLTALWLSEERFQVIAGGAQIPLTYPESARKPDIAVEAAEVAPQVSLSAHQELVATALDLTHGPATAKAVSEACHLPPNRTAEALAALVRKGVARKSGDTYPAQYELAPSNEESDR